MPASRILDSRLPEQHPKSPHVLGGEPQPATEPEPNIKGGARG
jgi:hypothetical protein